MASAKNKGCKSTYDVIDKDVSNNKCLIDACGIVPARFGSSLDKSPNFTSSTFINSKRMPYDSRIESLQERSSRVTAFGLLGHFIMVEGTVARRNEVLGVIS